MLRIRKLGWKTLDLEVPIGWSASCRVVERPGEWMSDAELERLVAELRTIATQTVRGGSLQYGVLSGDRRALARTIVTIVYARPRQAVAFSAMPLLAVTLAGRPREVLHLGLALVRPEARGRHFSRSVYGVTLLITLLRRGLRPLWVTNVSQVPSAIGSFASYFVDAFPALGSDCRTPTHRAIAQQVMARHRGAFGVGPDAEFDPLSFVIRNAYTGGSDNLKKSFTEVTQHRRSSYGHLCLATLDYDRGDDFLQVGRYTAFVVWRCLARRIRLTVGTLFGSRMTPPVAGVSGS